MLTPSALPPPTPVAEPLAAAVPARTAMGGPGAVGARPEGESASAAATVAVPPNPSLRLEPALGLVVLEFRDPGGERRTIPSSKELEAYRNAARGTGAAPGLALAAGGASGQAAPQTSSPPAGNPPPPPNSASSGLALPPPPPAAPAVSR